MDYKALWNMWKDYLRLSIPGPESDIYCGLPIHTE